MHQIRVALRGKGVVLMGKNTMVRRALRTVLAEFPLFERLLPHVKGNIGFVFTDGDLKEIRELIVANKVAAPARAGALAPKDVIVPAANTGMEPGKTSFFQALNIPTKISRGTIEIVSDVKVVTAGTRVGQSEATLLNMLGISPFTYGMTVVQIYDSGNVFPPSVLDIDDEELIGRFLSGIKAIAAISLALNYPTLASVTHSLVNSYKNLLAVAVETDISFEGADKASILSYVFLPLPPATRLYHTLKILNILDYQNLIFSMMVLSLFVPLPSSLDLNHWLTTTCANRSRSTSPTPRPLPLLLPRLPPPVVALLPLHRPQRRRSPSLRRSRTRRWASACSTTKRLRLASPSQEGE